MSDIVNNYSPHRGSFMEESEALAVDSVMEQGVNDPDLDGKIANILVNIGLFKNTNPNTITIFGIILNIIILYFIEQPGTSTNKITVAILLLLRCIADILDGAVARKYKKQSKLGGILDTFSDYMFIIVISYFIIEKNDLPVVTYSSVIVILLLILFFYNSYHDHSKLKRKNGTISDIVPLIVNNTIIVYYLIFVAYIYLSGNSDGFYDYVKCE